MNFDRVGVNQKFSSKNVSKDIGLCIIDFFDRKFIIRLSLFCFLFNSRQ